MRRTLECLAMALAPALVMALGAAGAAPGIEPAQKQFAADYIAAVRSQDRGRIRALFHPAVVACMTPANRPFFDELIAEEARIGTRPGPYEIDHVSRAASAPSMLGMPADGFTFPVRPTHEIQIDVRTGPNRSLSLIRYIANAGGRWFIVDPCPNAKGLRFIAAANAEGERQRAEEAKRLATMPPRLRAELKAMLAQGRRVDAIHRYRDATGSDLSMAGRVVLALEAESRPRR